MSELINHNISSPFKKQRTFERDIDKITFSALPQDKDLKKTPVYMNYYRLVREKIRRNAYQNYKGNINGEVFVSFRILDDGTLKGVNLAPRSARNRLLRKIALKSIKQSAPFPAFPEELKKYSHLQFNIPIYFKNN